MEDVEQASGRHLPVAVGSELVYRLPYQLMIAINGGSEEAHVPSKGGLPEST